MHYAMIMAGGVGSRLWPLSRRDRPKQLLPFINGRSLLELAFDRLGGVVDHKHRLICTAAGFRDQIHQRIADLDDAQIIGEPVGRNTLNAIGLTAAVLQVDHPEAVLAVLTADHIIEPVSAFQQALATAFAVAEHNADALVTFSIQPTWPAPGYGYVERGEPVDRFDTAHEVVQFVEKPGAQRAQQFIDTGRFAWNSGMFVFRVDTILRAIEKFAPDAHSGLMQIADVWQTDRRDETLQRVYPELPNISIDYGVMEPASRSEDFDVMTVDMPVSWIDVGSWPSYAETLSADASGNRSNCRSEHIDSIGMILVSDDPDHLIATIDCNDLIIVRTGDATLVCPRAQAQRVKELVDRLDERDRS